MILFLFLIILFLGLLYLFKFKFSLVACGKMNQKEVLYSFSPSWCAQLMFRVDWLRILFYTVHLICELTIACFLCGVGCSKKVLFLLV